MIKTITQLENLFRRQLMLLLGFDPDIPDPTGSPVRISWAAEGQPDINVTDNVVYVKLYDEGRQDIAQPIHTHAGIEAGERVELRSQTRVWRLELIAYGPFSYDWLYSIKRKCQQSEAKLLRAEGIYLVTAPNAPIRAPEYKNSLWFERSDLSLIFYENAIEKVIVPTIRKVTINTYLNNDTGQVIEGNIIVTDED